MSKAPRHAQQVVNAAAAANLLRGAARASAVHAAYMNTVSQVWKDELCLEMSLELEKAGSLGEQVESGKAVNRETKS